MDTRYTAGGFLYHATTGSVLLHHRDANAPRYPNLWAGFGGISEPADRGDPVATWRREMREELGVELAPEQVRPIQDQLNPRTGRHRYAFYAEWPTRDESFALTEGDDYGWFPLEDALALPDIVDRARDDLLVLRDLLAASPEMDTPMHQRPGH